VNAGRIGFDVEVNIRYELHGEQAYEFTRPVYVGDTFSATTMLTDAYERESRPGGTMSSPYSRRRSSTRMTSR